MAKEFGVTILLKGSTDIISDGITTTYLCKKDVPAMTVGGTGDVLSGLVAGFSLRTETRWNLQPLLPLSMVWQANPPRTGWVYT